MILKDHADRYNIEKTPTMYERYAIFVVTGRGVHKGLLLPDAAGSQIDVVPTILEMIAPRDFPMRRWAEALRGITARSTTASGLRMRLWGRRIPRPLVPQGIDR